MPVVSASARSMAATWSCGTSIRWAFRPESGRAGSAPRPAPAQRMDFVPCNAYALYLAISKESYGETLVLAPICTYYPPDALPDITTKLTIVDCHSTLTRTWDAGSYSLLTVGDCQGPVLSVASVTLNDGGCNADLTVINVNFTDGGIYGIDADGAIYIADSGFLANSTGGYGGAI